MTSAIIFDCDGVLADSEVIAHEIEMEVLAAIGLAYERTEFRERFMGMSDEAFWSALDRDGRERLGRSIREEIREPMKSRYRAALAERLTEVPGALACVSSLAHAKAVASSSTREGLRSKLTMLGLWEPFAPHIYSAEHVAHAKPAPDLFLHAAAQLGVTPRECLVIEDSLNGVRAGLSAGMRVWGFAGGGHMDEAAASRLVAAGAERCLMNWQEAGEFFREL